MGFLDRISPNPTIITSASIAAYLNKHFHGRWNALEDEMNMAFTRIIQYRILMKKKYPREHAMFLQDCINGRFITVTDFVLEILEIEIYNGYIPDSQYSALEQKIKEVLIRNGIPAHYT